MKAVTETALHIFLGVLFFARLAAKRHPAYSRRNYRTRGS
jgi:hypothetical protein